jgi:hypothetical protein
VSRRPLLLLPAVLVAVALPVGPAFAGEDDGDDDASLRQPRNCVSDDSAKVTVRGDDIDSVAFYVDGDLEKTVRRPTNRGTYVFAMSCSRFSMGAHRARAAVTFSGEESASETLRFTITRAAQGSPRFTG